MTREPRVFQLYKILKSADDPDDAWQGVDPVKKAFLLKWAAKAIADAEGK
jgi:hypothetical protein